MMKTLGMNYKAKTGAVVALTLEGEDTTALHEAASAIRAKKIRLYTDPVADETYLWGRTESGIRFSSENCPLSITWGMAEGGEKPIRIEGHIRVGG